MNRSTSRAPAGVLRCLAPAAPLALLLVPGTAWAQSNASPYTSGIRYDEEGRVTGTIAPDPDGEGLLHHTAVRNSYDAAGRLVRVETGELVAWQSEAVAPSDWSGFKVFQTLASKYDDMGRKLLDVASADGTVLTVTQTSYDEMGRVSCVALRMNRDLYPTAAATGGSLPSSACTLGTPGRFGADRITHNVYHVNGQLHKLQRAFGITTANGFPATLQQDEATYEYSANGRRSAVTDANGHRAEMIYDGLDRQSCWIFPSKTSPGAVGGDCATDSGDFERYGYDLADNRTTLRKRDGVTIGYQYDALNRMTQKTVPASATGAPGYSVFYGYDMRGLQTDARFGSLTGPGVNNTYDSVGRLTASTTTMDGIARTFSSQYDAAGNRIVLSGGAGYYASFAYDRLGRLTAYKEGGTPIVQFTYAPTGERSSLVTGAGATSSAGYVYDKLGRLETLTRELTGTDADQKLTFDYNPASQVVTRTNSNNAYASDTARDVSRAYKVNGLNQYTEAGPASFDYDANGNLVLTRTFSATGQEEITNFVYDAENRLVSASGKMNARLAYDPLGRLWQASGGAGGITRFVYDGDRLVEEYDGYGNRPRAYVHGPGADEPLVWYELTAGLSRRFYHTDHQGSIVALADEYGSPVAINGYDSWGIPNEGNVGRFQYTGQVWLPELGMYYYKARIYSPTLGRFMQTDPIGYEGGANLYAYVGNDPVNKTDAEGKYERDVHYDLTYKLALAAGYTPAMAHVVAYYDQYTDDNNMTGPFVSVEARILYHFPTQGALDNLRDSYRNSNDTLMEKGKSAGLYYHAYQDSFAHDGFEPIEGHLFSGHAPDKVENDVPKFNRMGHSFFERLVEDRGVLKQTGPVNRAAVSGILADHLKEQIAKREALERLRENASFRR